MEESVCAALYRIPGISQLEVREELEKGFVRLLGEIPLGGIDTFADLPVHVSVSRLPEFEKLTAVLADALEKIVRHYAADSRIRAIYDLSDELNSILQEAAAEPYAIGAYRPDFLQAENGQLKICEIGARFPLNGWMISYYMEQVVGSFRFWNTEKPVQLLKHMPEQFEQIFQKEKVLTLVMKSEKGYEIHWLLDILREKGFRSQICKPEELELVENEIQLNGKTAEQFILEMDRTELSLFRPGVLNQLIHHSRYINDVRTLILVHDKRVLAVLNDETIMRDYLDAGDYEFLRSWLVPAFALNDEALIGKLISTRENWVLKQSSGGRGVGMYIGHETEAAVWEKALRENRGEYMVQEYVKQHNYAVPTGNKTETMHLVGMLLCLNRTLCGPGVFRGSSNEVINVHQGRGVIFPMLTGSFSQ